MIIFISYNYKHNDIFFYNFNENDYQGAMRMDCCNKKQYLFSYIKEKFIKKRIILIMKQKSTN